MACHFNSLLNGLMTIHNKLVVIAGHLLLQQPLLNIFQNSIGIFSTRVIGGYDNVIGQLRCNFPHDRTLSPVTVSSTAKYTNDPALREFVHCAQHILEAVRRMRVIHDYSKGLACINRFYASFYTFDRFKAFLDVFKRNAFDQSCRHGSECIVHVKFTDHAKRNIDAPCKSIHME
ncbi:hypothetical protein D3C74_295910 [compost metagenome]